MASLDARVQSLFGVTKIVCFGRFVIELPSTAQVVWGNTDVPLGVWVEKGQAKELSTRIGEVESHWKSEIRFPRTQGLTLYLETVDGGFPGVRHVVSQQDASSKGLLRISSFFALGDDLVGLSALPLAREKQETIDELDDMARRLRSRGETEIPSDSGVCIDGAFLVDAPNVDLKNATEHVQVGFRLQEFPDVHLSLHLLPSTETKWSLDYQLNISEERARKAGEPEPFEELKIFRRAKREIHDWKTGYEILTRTPDEAGVHAYHDFWMKFTGMPGDPLRPFADIRLQTGVGENSAGAVKPSLTDEEAIALWDKLTSSIRVRPTGHTKTSQLPKPKAPLGELHVTGHRCPQAGWWECNDDLNLAQPSGIWLEEGQLMPKALIWAQPNLWDRLKGQRPVGWTPAVWRLAGYEKPQQTQ